MMLTLHSTRIITEIDGIPCRLWRGRTGAGRPVDVFILRVGSSDPAAQVELEMELRETGAPAECRMMPIWAIIGGGPDVGTEGGREGA